MKRVLCEICSFLKEKSKIVAIAVFLIVSIVLGVIGIEAADVMVAYSVSYGGQEIAIVESEKVFEDAKQITLSKLSGEKENIIYKPKFEKTLTLKKRLSDKTELSEEIFENTKEIVSGVVLVVGGEEKLFAKNSSELDTLLNERLHAYDVETADENISEFAVKVEIKDIYCISRNFADSNKIKDTISKIDVKTTIKYNEDVVVNYKTVTKWDSSKLYDYRQTVQNGANGLNHNVDMVVFLNGVETERKHLEQQVIKKPVNKIVVVGTKYPQDTTASAQGMVCPLPRGSYAITSQYGEYRSGGRHYALDLGTYGGAKQPIYAVKDGVVTKAVKSNTGYGYHIIIDHGAGVQTLYAHASALYVSVGDRVTQGQMIARVGSTGNSTGPHLHFEVIINGVKKNPNNYIKF